MSIVANVRRVNGLGDSAVLNRMVIICGLLANVGRRHIVIGRVKGLQYVQEFHYVKFRFHCVRRDFVS